MRYEKESERRREEFVYRITAADDWAEAQKSGIVPYGDIDRRDGYLHLSTRTQALDTAARYFEGRDDLLALEIMCTDIEEDLRFETVNTRGGVRFPHLYAQLPTHAVRRVLKLFEKDGVFQFADDAS